MWLNDLKNLRIYKSRYNNILSRNAANDLNDLQEMQDYKFALNQQECEELLRSKSQDIKFLRIQSDIKNENLFDDYLDFWKITPFISLNKLVFHQVAVTDEDLQVLSQNCPQLTSLGLIKCFCQHLQELEPGVNINMDHICHIRQLQELEMQCDKVREFQLEYVQQLLKSLFKLKSLNLKNFSIAEAKTDLFMGSYGLINIWNLEALNMGIINSHFWSTFTSRYLKSFPQLQDLTIRGSEPEDNSVVIDFKIVDTLRKYCKNLQNLKLENCQINVADFCTLQGLQELTLDSCRGLAFNNLQQILGGLKLRRFKLLNTRIDNVHNYIYMSSTLQSITIDTPNFMEISEIFQRSLNSFGGLQTLSWCSGDINHNWISDKCPKLQQLHIARPSQLSRIVRNLRDLKELTFFACHEMSWKLLKGLLFKLNLKRLTIYLSSSGGGDGGDSFKNHEICENFFQKKHTTLESLTISYELFLKGLKAWLELLAVNEGLRFVIYGQAETILNVKFVCLLLAEECVQQRREKIRICGLNLELENFQNDTILREIARLHLNTNHYRARKTPFTMEL